MENYNHENGHFSPCSRCGCIQIRLYDGCVADEYGDNADIVQLQCSRCGNSTKFLPFEEAVAEWEHNNPWPKC